MQRPREAEHEHMVARNENGVAVDEHSLVVADESGHGHLSGQFEVFHGYSRHFRARADIEFGHFGVGERQAFRGGGVGVEQYLEYRARGEEFLVHHHAYVQVFGLGDELYVFYVGYCFADAHLLGG